MASAPTEAPSPVIVSRLIASTFASSAVILYVLAQSGIASVPAAVKLSPSPETQAMVAGVAALLLVIALRTAPPAPCPPHQPTRSAFLRFFIAYALADLVAVCGFILALLLGDPAWSLFCSLGALGVVFRAWPKAEHFGPVHPSS